MIGEKYETDFSDFARLADRAQQAITGSIAGELVPSLITILICVVMECWRINMTKGTNDEIESVSD